MTPAERLPIPVTVITRADMDATAAAARRLTPDRTEHYPRAFEHWPINPDVFGPPLAIDCAELDRARVEARRDD